MYATEAEAKLKEKPGLTVCKNELFERSKKAFTNNISLKRQVLIEYKVMEGDYV